MDNILKDFSSQLKQGIKAVTNHITYYTELLRQGKKAEKDFFEGAVHTVYSLKAGAGFLGEDSIQKFFIAVERTFKQLQNGTLTLTAKQLDQIKKLLEDISDDLKNGESVDSDFETHVKRWKTVTMGTEAGNSRQDEDIKVEGEISNRFGFRVTKSDFEDRITKGELYLIRIDTIKELQNKDRSIMIFISQIARFGEIIDSNVNMKEIDENSFEMGFLFVSYHPLDIILAELDYLSADDFTKLEAGSSEKSGILIREVQDTPVDNAAVEAKEQLNTEEKKENFPRSSYELKENEPVDNKDKKDSVINPAKIMQGEEQKKKLNFYKEFVTFRLDDELYAVPIQMVHDIKAFNGVSLMPNQPSYVMGVINLRGNVVPLYDMRKLLGVRDRSVDETSVMVIMKISVNDREKIRGCLVDGISDVVTLEQQDKQITPHLSRDINRKFVHFIGKDRRSDSFLIVLDVEKMLQNSENAEKVDD